MIGNAKQVEHSLTKIHQIARERSLCTVRERSWIFLDKADLSRHQVKIPESPKPAPAMFVREYVSPKEPTTLTLRRKLTYNVADELRGIAQQLEPHNCLLDTGATLNRLNEAFLTGELILKCKKEQLLRLHTATKKSSISHSVVPSCCF